MQHKTNKWQAYGEIAWNWVRKERPYYSQRSPQGSTKHEGWQSIQPNTHTANIYQLGFSQVLGLNAKASNVKAATGTHEYRIEGSGIKWKHEGLSRGFSSETETNSRRNGIEDGPAFYIPRVKSTLCLANKRNATLYQILTPLPMTINLLFVLFVPWTSSALCMPE